MKITIERFGGGPCKLSEFAERHGLTMEVRERGYSYSGRALPRYYASFKGLETKTGAILSTESGDGSTPEEAIANHGRLIAGKRCVVNAEGPNRREFDAPNEFLPEDK